MASVELPEALGGASKTTYKRYRAVFDKFTEFAKDSSVGHWQQITKSVLQEYGRWLTVKNYAPATLYLELNTIKQAMTWLIEEKHLPESSKIHLSVQKSAESDTYCYTEGEVRAIISLTSTKKELAWLRDVVVGLVYTGLRISELAQLRWAMIDLAANAIKIADNTLAGDSRPDRVKLSTKNGHSRVLPIHPELRQVLERLKRHADGRVLHGPLGGVLKPDTVRRVLISKVLNPLKEKYPGQPGFRSFADGRLHSFRHFFCSKCAADGVPEQVVMKWLGHSSSRMVRRYYHLHDEESQRRIRQLKPITVDPKAIERKVVGLVAECIGIDPKSVTRTSSFAEHGAGPYEIAQLMGRLEREFDLVIPKADAMNMNTVGQAIDYIQNRGPGEAGVPATLPVAPRSPASSAGGIAGAAAQPST
jgi:acyl carrier protein